MAIAFTTADSISCAVAGLHPFPFFACLPEGSSQEQSSPVAGFGQAHCSYGLEMPTLENPSVAAPASDHALEPVFQTDTHAQIYQNFDVECGLDQTIFSPGALDALLKVSNNFQLGPDPLHACESNRLGREDVSPWPYHHYGETSGDAADTRSASLGLLPDGFTNHYETRFVDGLVSACDVSSDQKDDNGEQSGYMPALPVNDDAQSRARGKTYDPSFTVERPVACVFRETLEDMHNPGAWGAQDKLGADWRFGFGGADQSEDEDCEDTCRPLCYDSLTSSHLPRAAKALSALTRPNTAPKQRSNVTATRDANRSVHRESIKSTSKRRSPQRSKAKTLSQPVESDTKQASSFYATSTPCVQIELRNPTPAYVDQPQKGPKLVWKCPHNECDHVSRRHTDAKLHVLSHSSINIACPGCLHDYSRIDPLKRHAKTHQERPKLQKSSCATQNAPWTDKGAWNEANFLEKATFVETRSLHCIPRVVCVKWI